MRRGKLRARRRRADRKPVEISYLPLDEPLLRVFVYGTLKRGHRNHDRYCLGVVSIQPARVLGRLYHLPQGYPMLDIAPADILALGSLDGLADARRQEDFAEPRELSDPMERSRWHLIHGELLTFNDPTPRLAALDGLEGYLPQTTSGEYLRVLVPLVEPARMRAWTYIAPQGRLPSGATPCGDEWGAFRT